MTPAWSATSPDEVLEDPALEARARALGKELRCLVCQNQSIDDSDAELAQDLRALVRERLVAGDSDAEIKAFLTARYGDFVLLKPPMAPGTYLLWFAPLVLLIIGGGLLALVWKRRGQATALPPNPLTVAERAELERLIEGRPDAETERR
ncbi:MAG: cytochrome c-type biogenesis protein [Geminicoccaceae bacterium]